MTSSATPGVIPPVRARGVRVAFDGRVACSDDPHTAIHGQPRALSTALPTEARIIGYFADVGPRNGLRGRIHPTDTWHLEGRPVEGGLIELLACACRARGDLDVITGSDADRLSRQLSECLRIGEHLACHGVRVFTPDDSAITTLGTVPAAPRPRTAPPSLSDRARLGCGGGEGRRLVSGAQPSDSGQRAPRRPPRGPRARPGLPWAPRRFRRGASGRHAEAEVPEVVGEIRILDGAEGNRLALQQARVLWEVSHWWVRNNSKPGPGEAG